MRTNRMWLGDPDCGEGLPDRPEKGPCHTPDGPCVPTKRPGYPAKPKARRKDFCFECPPKKSCNLNKCPADSDGMCGKAKAQQGDQLKLHSESQAVIVSAVKMNLEGLVARSSGGFTWIGNRAHTQNSMNFQCRTPRRYFSHSDGTKPPQKPPSSGKTSSSCEPCPKSPPKSDRSGNPKCQESPDKALKTSVSCEEISKKPKPQETKCSEKPKPPKPPAPQIARDCKAAKSPQPSTEPKVLYRKCPPLPKLPKLPECPKLPETKSPETCEKLIIPKCPPPPSLPKCPECPSQPVKSTEKSPSASPCPKKEAPPTKVCSSKKKKVEKKKKGIWERLNECKKRKFSTYVRSSQPLDVASFSWLKTQTRDLRTSGPTLATFSSKSDSPPPLPPWKPSKCKTIEEVCGEQVDPKLKALECKPMDCPRNPNAECYPKKPRCGEVRQPVKKVASGKMSSSKKNSDMCGTKKGEYGTTVIPKNVEKIIYTKPKCDPPKLRKLGSCPTPPQSFHNTGQWESEVEEKKTAPLPKPPSCPVVLCPCTPPPKLHPGSCPCYVDVEDSQPKPRTEPCPAKVLYSCPEVRVYYCSPKKDVCNLDKCKDEKRPKKPRRTR